MKSNPILAIKTLPSEPWHRGKRATLTVYGGLHYIQGNSAPHFTLTADVRLAGCSDIEQGGCCHDLILEHFPEFADLAAMHLSEIGGEPMHGESNGWYSLAGYFGGIGEPYHRGNQGLNWKGEGKTTEPDECLRIFAEHCRLSIDDARALAERIAGEFNVGELRNLSRSTAGPRPHPYTYCGDKPAALNDTLGWVSEYPDLKSIRLTLRECWRVEYAKMAERHRAEAEACIKRHGLRVFGDHWEPKATDAA